MYVHLGGEVCISARDIILCLDLDAVTVAGSETRKYLTDMEERGRIDPVLPELPRTVVITGDKAYLTPLSVAAIEKRLNGSMF